MSTAVVEKARGRWSCPDARLVLPADAPREQWLAQRRHGLGGSDASTVAGVNPWSSLYELWLDKTGRLEDQRATARMEAGTRLEPVLRPWFTDKTGIPVRRAGLMASKTRPWQLVSVDGLTEDGGLYESKTTNWRLAEEWADDQIADHAEVQVQHGLAVTGRSHAWVVCLVDGWDFQIRRVERDEELIKTLTGMEARFWAEHVLADVEPPITADALSAVKTRWSSVATEYAVADPADIVPLHARLLDAKAAVKAAERTRDELEAQMREHLADAEALVAGGKVYATCKEVTTHRIDTGALKEQLPDVAEEFTKTSTYRRLNVPAKPKEA